MGLSGVQADKNASIPIFRPDVMRKGPDGLRLLGSGCPSCNRIYFPRTSVCLACLATNVEDRELSQEGDLECFTTVHMPAVNIDPPYMVGYVRLPEGLRIFAPIKTNERNLRMGMRVRLSEYRLGRGGTELLAYCFTPLESEQA